MMNGNGQAKGKEPVDRVVDLFLHMPIGLAVMAWKRVPDLVVSVPGLVNEALSKSCAQIAQAEERLSEEVRKARMIGQVAVTFGGRQLRREVDARLRDARQTAGGLASFLPGGGGEGDSGPDGSTAGSAASNGAAAATADRVTVTGTPAEPVSAGPASSVSAPAGAKVPPSRPKASPTAARKPAKAPTAKTPARPTRPAAKKPAAKKPSTKKPATAKATAAAPPPSTAADLPIREYDGLSASQVVSRLTGLTPDELRAVRAYEDASRGRRTVLLAIDRLVAGSGEAGPS
jgi:hypothetical protein